MRCDDKGMALVSVVLMLAALLAMAQVLVEKIWQSTQQGVAADRREFLFWAAQSGLESARKRLAEGYLDSSGWQTLLTAAHARDYPESPAWVDHLNGQRVEVFLRDNEDGDDDFRHDNDLKIYVLLHAVGDVGGEALIESLCGFEATSIVAGDSLSEASGDSFTELLNEQESLSNVME